MIDTHGMQLAKQLLHKQPSLQIILLQLIHNLPWRLFEVEATDYLLKPVQEKRLINALTKAQKKWS